LDKPTSILLVLGDSNLIRRVVEECERDEGLQVIGVARELAEAVQMAVTSKPEIIIIGDCSDAGWVEVCNFVRLALGESWIIALFDHEPDRQTIDTAMLLGARQVLAGDEGLLCLRQVINHLLRLEGSRVSEEYVRATDPQRFPRIISVCGAKGGVGKTTIAVNLAVALAAKNVGGVAIWDAYSQFGDVATIMGLEAPRFLGELAEFKNEDVDEDFIANYIVHHNSGADAVITSHAPLGSGTFSQQLTDKVVQTLRRRYRFIVVDTPPMIDTLSSSVFARCWRLLLITTLRDVTSLTDMMKLIQMLEGRYVRGGGIEIIANCVVKGDAVRKKEIESLTSKNVAICIPEDPAIRQANNLGKPLCQSDSRSPAAKAIIELSDEIVNAASIVAPNAAWRTE